MLAEKLRVFKRAAHVVRTIGRAKIGEHVALVRARRGTWPLGNDAIKFTLGVFGNAVDLREAHGVVFGERVDFGGRFAKKLHLVAEYPFGSGHVGGLLLHFAREFGKAVA